MRTFLTMYKKEFSELSGTKKLLVLGILFVFFALLSPVTAKILPSIMNNMEVTPGMVVNLPEATFYDAIDQFMKNLSQLGAFVLIFIVAGAIAEEKVKKTLELVLVKPVKRSTYVLAKFFSYLAAVFITYWLAVGIFYGYSVALFGSFSFSHVGEMMLLTLVYLFLVIVSVLLASSIANSSLLASGIGFGFMIFFGAIWDLIPGIKNVSPGYIIGHYKQVAQSGWNIDFLWPALVSIGLMVLMVMLAVMIFRRQEIER